jgi:hypothetical protein
VSCEQSIAKLQLAEALARLQRVGYRHELKALQLAFALPIVRHEKVFACR